MKSKHRSKGAADFDTVCKPTDPVKLDIDSLIEKAQSSDSNISTKRKSKKSKKHMREKKDEVDEDSDEGEKGSESSDDKKSKKRKLEDISDVTEPSTDADSANTAVQAPHKYCYSVDDDDHCETPENAYADINKTLEYMLCHTQKDQFANQTETRIIETCKDKCMIYDPFFCQGSVVKRLGAQGYSNVYNKEEDFYALQRVYKVPSYDILLTNPPYSSNHMHRLLKYCKATGKPFCLLLPNYVYMKEYYKPALGDTPMFYIIPNRRYLYTTPYGRRQQKSSKYTSPFSTFWYCSLGSNTSAMDRDNLITKLNQYLVNNRSCGNGGMNTYRVVESIEKLPREIQCDNDPRKHAKPKPDISDASNKNSNGKKNKKQKYKYEKKNKKLVPVFATSHSNHR